MGRRAFPHERRASLARIFRSQAEARELQEREADLSQRYSEQLTLFDLASCSSKTAHESAPKGGTSLSPNLWREDTPGKTEFLRRLMLEPPTRGTDGGALLPTLTVCGNWNRKGASANSGDGIATALKRLPTLCASDYKSPYSAEGYAKQKLTRYKPLRDTLVHTTGHRLTPAFAEWWMGWPIHWTVVRRVPGSKQRAMVKSQSQQPPPG